MGGVGVGGREEGGLMRWRRDGRYWLRSRCGRWVILHAGPRVYQLTDMGRQDDWQQSPGTFRGAFSHVRDAAREAQRRAG